MNPIQPSTKKYISNQTFGITISILLLVIAILSYYIIDSTSLQNKMYGTIDWFSNLKYPYPVICKLNEFKNTLTCTNIDNAEIPFKAIASKK